MHSHGLSVASLPPKKICPCPNSWNLWMLSYLEKSFFADIIKLKILRWGDHPRLSGWGLNPLACALVRDSQRWLDRSREERHRERSSYEDGGEDRGDVTTSRGMPSATGTWKRQGRILLWSLQREWGPADILILDFWPPEVWKNKFLLFLAHPVCDNSSRYP